MQLQAYDIIMVLVLLAAIGFGAWKGLAWQLASLCAIFVSYFVAYQLREPVSRYVSFAEPWNRIIAMLGLYLGTCLVVWIAFGFVRNIIDRVKLQDFDRHAGAVLGAVKGVILCMIITLFAVALLTDEQKEHVCCSYSGYVMSKIIDKVDVAMPEEVQGVLHPYLEKLDSELSHNHDGHGHDHSDDHSDKSSDVPAQQLFDAGRTAQKLLDATERLQSNR